MGSVPSSTFIAWTGAVSIQQRTRTQRGKGTYSPDMVDEVLLFPLAAGHAYDDGLKGVEEKIVVNL